MVIEDHTVKIKLKTVCAPLYSVSCSTLDVISVVSFVVSQIRELVPESQAYMDLLAFERKLDQTIMRKRLDIQEALKRPIKVCFSLSFHSFS